mgnify:CR=1 FL=1
MAKISSYANVVEPIVTDRLIGTEISAPGGVSNPTKNFVIQDVINLSLKNGIFASPNNIPAYDDNAAAVLGGLVNGQLFVTSGLGALAKGIVCIVY